MQHIYASLHIWSIFALSFKWTFRKMCLHLMISKRHVSTWCSFFRKFELVSGWAVRLRSFVSKEVFVPGRCIYTHYNWLFKKWKAAPSENEIEHEQSRNDEHRLISCFARPHSHQNFSKTIAKTSHRNLRIQLKKKLIPRHKKCYECQAYPCSSVLEEKNNSYYWKFLKDRLRPVLWLISG